MGFMVMLLKFSKVVQFYKDSCVVVKVKLSVVV